MNGAARPWAAALLLLAALSGVAAADLGAFKRAWAAAERAPDEDARNAARIAAVQGIPSGDDPDAWDLLASLALDGRLDYRVRDAAEDAMATQRGPGVEAHLRSAFGLERKRPKERKVERRVLFCYVLGRRVREDAQARGLVLGALRQDPSPEVAGAALRTLRDLRQPEVIAACVARLQASAEVEEAGRLRADLRQALSRWSGESFPSAAEWASWWEAQGGELPGEAPAAEPAPRTSTRTRLDPPRGGRTIYGEVASSRVLFVIDVSGSMRVPTQDSEGARRTRLDYVRDALKGVLAEQLDGDDAFTLLAFSSQTQLMSRKLIEASPRSRKKAVAWLDRLEADGGTNVYQALEEAFKVPEVDTIYFLSDGSPSEGTSIVTTEILGQVRAWNRGRGVRIEAIGFLAGDGAPLGVTENKGMAKRFLEALAERNDGRARFFE